MLLRTTTRFCRLYETATFAVALFGLMFAGCSQRHAEAVDPGSRWWAHVEYLASDDLQGRFTGSEGYRKAADYTAHQFQTLGLQAAGTNGYFQPVDFETRRLVPEKSTVELIKDGKAIRLAIPGDVLPGVAGTSGEVVQVPSIFAGYGLSIPEAHYDDSSGVKTNGAVAIAFEGAPKNVPSLLAAHYSSLEMVTKNWQRLGIVGGLELANPRVLDPVWPPGLPMRCFGRNTSA